MQDTLLKGITHIDSIKPAKFMSWLFKVATHKYYDLYRKETRRGKTASKTVSFELLSFMDESSPEDRYLRKEKSLGVKELLNRIPQKYKQMLILKYDLGLSYDEIGRLLNVKTERVKTDLYRARNMFKKMYEGERQDEQ